MNTIKFVAMVIIAFIICYLGLIGICDFEEDLFRVHSDVMLCSSCLKYIEETVTNYINNEENEQDGILNKSFYEQKLPDLLQQLVKEGIVSEKELCCQTTGHSFLYFPVPISVFKNNKNPHGIPLVVDHPDFHQVRPNLLIASKFLRKDWYKSAISARVLYSDGTIKEMSKEDADKLIFQQAVLIK